jgi:hypothetical protein
VFLKSAMEISGTAKNTITDVLVFIHTNPISSVADASDVAVLQQFTKGF